jgi:hypothetical protein
MGLAMRTFHFGGERQDISEQVNKITHGSNNRVEDAGT